MTPVRGAAATPDAVDGLTAAPPGLVFGIDVVALARAQQLLERYDEVILRRVATAAEARWIGTAPARLGAVLGVKEAAIKAMGGRPEPFTWQQISTGAGELSVVHRAPADLAAGGWPSAVIEVLTGFAAGLHLAELTTTTCQLHDGSLGRVSSQLSAVGRPGRMRGAGCFGLRDEHVFAAVCFWKEDDDE